MSAQQQSWERQLLAWAAEGLQHDPQAAAPVQAPIQEAQLLDGAYAPARRSLASRAGHFTERPGLLPGEKRHAVRALYAFCRITDDIIDRAGDEPEAALAAWKERTLFAAPLVAAPLVAAPSPDDLVVRAWADTRARYCIPTAYAVQLIDGVARDLTTTRYATFDDLAAYCYGVASTVGLLSMHIIGFGGHQAIPYAVKLGLALQITNILRDVREDWEAGRVYLPQDELAAFGLNDDDISTLSSAGFRGKNGLADRWRMFMQFQIERNRQLYSEAVPGIAWLDPAGRFASLPRPGCIATSWRAIAAREGDVFTHRLRPSTRTALCRARSGCGGGHGGRRSMNGPSAPTGGALAMDLGGRTGLSEADIAHSFRS